MQVGVAAIWCKVGSSGGAAIFAKGLAEALVRHGGGLDVRLLVDESSHGSWSDLVAEPRVCRLAESERRRSVRLLHRMGSMAGLGSFPSYGSEFMAKSIDSLDLDIVHYPATTIYPLSLRTPCLLTFFDMQHEFYPEFFSEDELRFRDQSYRASVEKAVHVVAPSEYTKRTLLELYGTSEDKVTVIPAAVDDTFCVPSPEAIAAARRRYQLPDEFLFYPANPWPHKNHARLFAALRLYRDRYGLHPPLVLSGRLAAGRRVALELAVAAGIEADVIDLGFVPAADLPGLYGAATALVFPSLFEGFCLPLAEAMACGCPIAAAAATAIPECVGEAAILFDPKSVTAICEAVRSILVDASLRRELREAGFAMASRYSWRELTPKVVELYRRFGRALRACYFPAPSNR